jgi:hypothetical protein
MIVTINPVKGRNSICHKHQWPQSVGSQGVTYQLASGHLQILSLMLIESGILIYENSRVAISSLQPQATVLNDLPNNTRSEIEHCMRWWRGATTMLKQTAFKRPGKVSLCVVLFFKELVFLCESICCSVET